MAGMLPGVEYARRRRCRLGGSIDPPSGSRRPHLCSNSTCMNADTMPRRTLNKGLHGGSLGEAAREAKERLDERLRTQRSTEINRHNSVGSMRNTKHIGRNCSGGSTGTVLGNVQREVFCTKKSARRLGWIKKEGKAPEEQDECVVCLEEYRAGDILVNLRCAHRFHWNCVAPWLESSPHCPCCRLSIFSQG